MHIQVKEGQRPAPPCPANAGARQPPPQPQPTYIPGVPYWVNRKTRVRHSDPQCRALGLSARYIDAIDDPDAPRAQRKHSGRIAELPEAAGADELAAIEAFTTPCVHCVPGARSLWAAFPLDFEQTYEYDD